MSNTGVTMSLYEKYSENDSDDIFVNFIENQFEVKEFDIIKPLEYADKFIIEFKPTDQCNFDCSYCCFHDNTTKHISDETFDKYLTMLSNFGTDNKDEIFLFVYGGEPTMHPKLTEMIIRINELYPDKKVNTLIQTNGMRWDEEDYRVNHELLTGSNVEYVISFSYHKEFTKTAGVIKRIKYLQTLGVMDVLTYMITREDIDKHIQMINIFNSLNIPLYVRTILQESEWFLNSKYKKYITLDPDETPFLLTDETGTKEVSFEYITMHGYLNFKGYQCTAGKNTLLLAPNGKVYRCDMDFLYDKNIMFDVTKSLEQVNVFSDCLTCEHKFCSIYYGVKFK